MIIICDCYIKTGYLSQQWVGFKLDYMKMRSFISELKLEKVVQNIHLDNMFQAHWNRPAALFFFLYINTNAFSSPICADLYCKSQIFIFQSHQNLCIYRAISVLSIERFCFSKPLHGRPLNVVDFCNYYGSFTPFPFYCSKCLSFYFNTSTADTRILFILARELR